MESNQCPCKRTDCERHGNCEECRKTHLTKRYPPACERTSNRRNRRERSRSSDN